MPTETYSTCDAKARFSELLEKVRARRRIIISRHGKPVAMLVPLPEGDNDIDTRLARLEAEGIVDAPRGPAGPLRPIARRRGALSRFLAERE